MDWIQAEEQWKSLNYPLKICIGAKLKASHHEKVKAWGSDS